MEYAFVRHEVTYRRGMLDPQGYEDVVHRRARDGWRLVQVLVEQPAATVSEYVLIFERPRSDDG